jgi:hypothetical protein
MTGLVGREVVLGSGGEKVREGGFVEGGQGGRARPEEGREARRA